LIRDPFYNQIVQRLNQQLDPDTFEKCACSILREFHPTLVPIPGGSDAGMDGAISDGQGRAFPLICTTQKNVIENLTKSLSSYKKKIGRRKKVILATSRELTPTKRRNLEKRAGELGFIPIQIYTQSAIAELLYNKPRWCKELLGLEGKVQALSTFPQTRRCRLSSTLIGREEDKKWLTRIKSDVLLVGQPGSGKTFLLYTFAKENNGFFVVSDDIDNIAEELRSKKPKFLIVDDALLGNKLILIEKLKHLRNEIYAEFRIIATCWPSKRDSVISILNITNKEENIRNLSLLTREQIVEVIKGCGIGGPNQLIREIVNQAVGKPGLAATLCYLCISGEIDSVVLGDALSRDTKATFEPLVGEKATQVLATFSLGGEAGFPMAMVADELSINLTDLQSMVTQLAAGGVLREIQNANLSVMPTVLRYSLVRDVFFRGAASLPYSNLIEKTLDKNQALLTLLGAKHRRANISDKVIVPLLEQYGDEEAWEAFAWLGHKEAGWIIENHSERLICIVKPALHHVPNIILPLLFEKAIDDNRPLHSNLSHPLRIIEDWVKEAIPGKEDAVKCRKKLFESALQWIEQNKDLTTGLKAISIALNPAFQTSETSPGSGMSVMLIMGHITEKEMKEIQTLWPQVLNILRTKKVENWEPIKELAAHWIHCHFGPTKVSPEIRKLMKSFARKILNDINTIVKSNQGMLHWIKSQCINHHFRIKVCLDRDFEILYPIGRNHDWEKQSGIHSSNIKKLSSRWATKKAESVVKKLISFKQQSKFCGHVWPELTPNLCSELSQKTTMPEKWVELLLKHNGEGYWVLPFLEKTISLKRPNWEALILQCLRSQNVKSYIIPSLIINRNISESIFDEIIKEEDVLCNSIIIVCMRGEVPRNRLKKLLNHRCNKVAGCTAIGMWEANKNIDTSLFGDWSRAIINYPEKEYHLKSVFETYPDIAFQWLLQNKEVLKYFWHEHKEDPIATAVRVLSVEHRERLIKELPSEYSLGNFIHELIGNNSCLYELLLKEKKHEHIHLSYFEKFPDENWITMAKLSLNHGHKPDDIAYAAICSSRSWSGKESNMWKEWSEKYSFLLNDRDGRIVEIGKIVSDYAQKQKVRALEEEKEEDIYGRF